MRLDVYGLNYELNDDLNDHIERCLTAALGRLKERIDRVTIRVVDVNGPRGGIDKRCRIIVSLNPRGKVIVTGADRDPFVLVTRAARRTGQIVRRVLGRRRWACA